MKTPSQKTVVAILLILSALLLMVGICRAQIIYNIHPAYFKELPPGTEIYNDYLTLNRNPAWTPKAIAVTNQMCIDSARRYGMKIILQANATYPSLSTITKYDTVSVVVCWYCYDEASGHISEKTAYNLVETRNVSQKNCVVTMNNFLRIWEVSADEIWCDPYTDGTPKVAYKQVYVATREACAYGPCGTILNSYWEVQRNDKRLPAFEELRCQIYLALVGGCNKLGLFSCDTRILNRTTKELEGWTIQDDPARWAFTKSLLFEIAALRPYMATKCEPIPTGVAGVYAARRGGKSWIVNSTRNTVFAMGLILGAMEVREIN